MRRSDHERRDADRTGFAVIALHVIDVRCLQPFAFQRQVHPLFEPGDELAVFFGDATAAVFPQDGGFGSFEPMFGAGPERKAHAAAASSSRVMISKPSRSPSRSEERRVGREDERWRGTLE